MKLLPDNIEPDKYLGKGLEYLYYAIACIVIIIVFIFIGLAFKEYTIADVGTIISASVGTAVALLVAIFTFLAFYVQYDANKKIQKQFEVQQFESQFYKMLDLHKSNIDEFYINYIDSKITEKKILDTEDKSIGLTSISSSQITREIVGRSIFVGMVKELDSIIRIVLDTTQNHKKINFKKYPNIYNYLLTYAYRIFFFGLTSEQATMHHSVKSLELKITIKALDVQKKFFQRREHDNKNNQDPSLFDFYPYEGHETRLSHYYRNLYSIVKLVVQRYDNTYGSDSYNIARNYLKILRAQLSNSEQHLLYLNYRIGFGQDWDKLGKQENQYMTKYRMVHNLPVDRINIPENPRKHFQEYINSNEVNTDDTLFEWGDY